MPTFESANTVLNDAAVELGLIPTDLADIYLSTDPAIVQLRRLLKGLGRDLLRQFRWTHLQRTHTFTTVAGTDTYLLPTDFSRILDSTAWNRSQQMPLGGPFYAQGWQWLKAHTASGTTWLNYRIVGNRLALHPTPAGFETLAYEYISDLWVGDDLPPAAPTRTAPLEVATDVLFLDARLLVTGLVLRFREAKGFDTSAAQRTYNDALAAAQGGDGAAPVLSFSGCGTSCCDVPMSGSFGAVGGPSPSSGAVLDFGSILGVGGLF